jgi:hypothetical protein
MRTSYRTAMAAVTLVVLSAASSADRLREEPTQPATEQITETPTGTSSSIGTADPPTATVLDSQEVEGILGKEVRGSADQNMGRIINVVVDRSGQPRAAVIDFGGFLGVGSRRLAVDWKLLHIAPAGDARGRITLELTPDQVRAAPEYREGKPVVVLGALGNAQSWPFTNSAVAD